MDNIRTCALLVVVVRISGTRREQLCRMYGKRSIERKIKLKKNKRGVVKYEDNSLIYSHTGRRKKAGRVQSTVEVYDGQA